MSMKNTSPKMLLNSCAILRKNPSAAKMKRVAEMRSRLNVVTKIGIAGGAGVAVHLGSATDPSDLPESSL